MGFMLSQNTNEETRKREAAVKGKHKIKAQWSMAARRKAAAYCLQHGLLTTVEGVKNAQLFAIVEQHAGGKSPADIRPLVRVPKQLDFRAAQKAANTEARKTPRLRIFDDDFYNSREWKKLRYQALLKYGAACQCCGATRADGVKLHVDHIKPRSKFPELQWDLANLQVLCEHCNLGKGAWDETDWRDNKPVIWAD